MMQYDIVTLWYTTLSNYSVIPDYVKAVHWYERFNMEHLCVKTSENDIHPGTYLAYVWNYVLQSEECIILFDIEPFLTWSPLNTVVANNVSSSNRIVNTAVF